jgi:hypothetical protein
MLVEKAACRLLKTVSKHDVRLELGTPQVEVPMAQSQLFCGELFSLASRDWNLWSIRRADHAQRGGANLDISRRHLGVAHFLRPETHFAIDGDNCLLSEPTCRRDYIRWRPLGIEGHLNDSGAVAKIHEHDSAKVSRTVNPAGDCHAASGVLGPQGTS